MEFLNYFRSKLALNASIDNGRAIFMGRPDKHSFSMLLQRYLKERVICPVCNRPDTHLEKEKQTHDNCMRGLRCKIRGKVEFINTAGCLEVRISTIQK